MVVSRMVKESMVGGLKVKLISLKKRGLNQEYGKIQFYYNFEI